MLAERWSLEADGRGRLTLPGLLQGFPETAHGGAVLAAFDQIAAPWISPAARTVTAQIQKSVPLETPLPLRVEPAPGDVSLTLGEDRRPLARARVASTPHASAPARDGWGGVPARGLALPTSRGCLACGTENPVGLRVQLRFEDRWVWAQCRPTETYRTPDGRIAPVLYTVLLDEMAWWLGALASGEAGVTTEFSVTLYRPAHPFGETLLALGARDRVAVTDERGHFWMTETAVLAPDGAPLAWGRITFAGSRAYSKRLVPRLLEWNPPERLRPIFPTHIP